MVAVYPGSEKYYSDFFYSITNQTENNFDLLVLCDGTSVNIAFAKGELFLEKIPKGKTPAQVRGVGIKFAIKNNYQFLVFTDIDDYFSENRLETSVKGLRENCIVYNDLVPVNELGRTLFANHEYFSFPDKINDFNCLLHYNIIGMGSAAVQVRSMPKIDIPPDVIAVDWWFFTVLLLNGMQGNFLKDVKTFYRQGNNNLVGSYQKLTNKRLDYGIKVKLVHYNRLFEYCIEHGYGTYAEIFFKEASEIQLLQQAIADEKFRDKYLLSINNRLPEIYKGWWSEILPLKDWKKYDNI